MCEMTGYKETLENILLGMSEPRMGVYAGTPGCDTVAHVADAFKILLPELMQIMRKNLSAIGLQPGENLQIGTLQPAATSIGTDVRGKVEYFCTLTCFIKSSDGERQENIMVNFTTGEIMNENRFMQLLEGETFLNGAGIYGNFSKVNLSQAWNVARNTEKKEQFENRYISCQQCPEQKKTFFFGNLCLETEPALGSSSMISPNWRKRGSDGELRLQEGNNAKLITQFSSLYSQNNSVVEQDMMNSAKKFRRQAISCQV